MANTGWAAEAGGLWRLNSNGRGTERPLEKAFAAASVSLASIEVESFIPCALEGLWDVPRAPLPSIFYFYGTFPLFKHSSNSPR